MRRIVPTLLTVVLAAIATTIMLEAMRVFVSYMVFVVDQSRRAEIAAITFGVFGAVGLGGLVSRIVGRRPSLALAVGLLALARLVLQFWELPLTRLVLGAAVVVAWGWLVIPLLTGDGDQRRATALGLTAGTTLDLALRIAAGTVDLPWMPGLAAHLTTLVLLLLLVALALLRDHLYRPSRDGEGGGGRALALVSVGPGLALYQLVSGNLGLAQVRLDAGLPTGAAVLALGAGLGLLVSALLASGLLGLFGPRRSRRVAPTVTLGLVGLVALGNWLTWQDGLPRELTGLGLLLVAAAGSALLTQTMLAGLGLGTPGRTAGTTVWFTFGLLLQAGSIFLYYTFSGRPSLLWLTVGLLALGPLLALIGPAGPRPAASPAGVAIFLPAAVVPTMLLSSLLLLVCLARWVTWSAPVAGPPLGAELTVMTYNIQNGFARDDTWNLERTARAITAEQPDVVVLQEVSRGWLVTGGVDEVLWLSRRLNMPIVFGPNSDDGLWGNAILTRAPLLGVAHRQYRSTQNLKRAAIEVQLATAAGPVWIYGTHLDDPAGAEAVRLDQTRQLLGFWDGRAPALILGDLNADPGSTVLNRLTAAGLRDLAAPLGPSAFTSHDRRRIDYVLGTADIDAVNVHIPDVWASDHRPVVVSVRVRR